MVETGSVHIMISNNPELRRELLKTIAYRNPYSGQILLNGKVRPSKDWRMKFGLVPYKDDLFGKLTVEEHLKLAISMRLWRTALRAERKRILLEKLEYFNLQPMRKRTIHRPHKEQALPEFPRKMLAIGNDVLMLMDPLEKFESGRAAEEEAEICDFMTFLKKLANDLDCSVLLSTGRMDPIFLESPFRISIIADKTLVFTGAATDLKEGGESSLEARFSRLSEILFAPPTSRQAMEERSLLLGQLDHPLALLNDNHQVPYDNQTTTTTTTAAVWPPPWHVSLWNLMVLQLKEDFRSIKFVLGLTLTNAFVYLLLSFVFFQLPVTKDGLADREGLLYFLNINTLFTNSLSRLVRFDHTMHHFSRDRKIRLYQSSALIWSQFFAVIPLRSLNVIIFGTALYYITGLRADGFQHFIVFISDLLLMTFASVALGMLVAVCVKRLEYGQVVMPFIVIVSFIFGNLDTAPNATWILKWIQYVTPVYYSFQCLIQNELVGAFATDGTDVNLFLSVSSFDNMPIAACLPALAGFTLIYLIGTTIVYHFRFPVIKID